MWYELRCKKGGISLLDDRNSCCGNDRVKKREGVSFFNRFFSPLLRGLKKKKIVERKNDGSLGK